MTAALSLPEYRPGSPAEEGQRRLLARCRKCRHEIARTSTGWGTPDRVLRGCYHRPESDWAPGELVGVYGK